MKFLLIGLGGGVLAGMGLGGGTLMIPLLLWWGGLEQAAAQGLNLAAFLPSAALALWLHVRAGRVQRGFWRAVLGWALAGSAAGLLLALALPSEWLRRGFGVFLILLGASQWRGGGQKPQQSPKARICCRKGGAGHADDL